MGAEKEARTLADFGRELKPIREILLIEQSLQSPEITCFIFPCPTWT